MSKAQMLKRLYFIGIPISTITGGVCFGIGCGYNRHSDFKIYNKYQNPRPEIKAKEITADAFEGACMGALAGTLFGLTWPVVVPTFIVSYLANK